MTGDDMQRVIRRISHEILESHRGVQDVVLVGIHTRGVPLASVLGETIAEFEGSEVPVGSLDVSLHRDDLDFRSDRAARETTIPTSIDDKHIVVVDDVLFTGRTVRASLDALSGIGRAASVQVAVMIDRGHRELPIRADYVGKNLPTSRHEVVRVRLAETDGCEGVWIEDADL